MIIEEIPNSRNRRIIELFFGFNNQEPLKKCEIAKIFNISQSIISRIVYENLNYIIELSNKEKQLEVKRAKSLTEFFNCQEDELLNLFNSLNSKEQELLMYRNGRDLKEYNQGKFSDSNLEKKYYHLTRKCRRLIKLARFNEKNNREFNNSNETRSFIESEGIVLTKVPIRKNSLY